MAAVVVRRRRWGRGQARGLGAAAQGAGWQEEGGSIRRSREGSGKGAATSGAELPPPGKRRRSTEAVEDSLEESSTVASCFRPPKRLRYYSFSNTSILQI